MIGYGGGWWLQNMGKNVGDGPQSWVGEFMGVVCGEVFAWDGRILVKIVSLLLGWGIE